MRTPHLKPAEKEINLLSAFLSNTGKQNKSSDKLAKSVLSRVPLYEITETLNCELKEIGLSISQINKLNAAFNMVKWSTFMKRENSPYRVNNSTGIYNYIINNKEAFPYSNSGECFFLVGFSLRMEVTAVSFIAKGSMGEVTVPLPSVLRESLKMGVPRFMIVHNHPSGDSSPSDADRSLTRIIQKSIETIGLELIDHIIVGQGEYYSFADKGYL